MGEEPDLRVTRDAYDGVAERYAQLFSRMLAHRPLDRALLGAFAELVLAHATATGAPAAVADLGCGPGHITAHLRELGVDAFGIDLSPQMIMLARRDRPGLRFEVGNMHHLALADGALGGAVAWYSIIHTPPARVPALFAEFARVLAPGGHLLLAFQAADAGAEAPQPHPHLVTPSHRWSPEAIAGLLRPAGFVESARLLREPDATERLPSAVLLAHRPSPA